MEANCEIDTKETLIYLDHIKKEIVNDEIDSYEENKTFINENNNSLIALDIRNSRENKQNLIDFLEHNDIMEDTAIKLEIVKGEFREIAVGFENDHNSSIVCQKCDGIYSGYCFNCSSLCRILNNNIILLIPEWKIQSIPADILEIRDNTPDGKAVFTLKALPKNVIFGHFDGILSLTNNRYIWQMKDQKLLNIENGNWMQYVASVSITVPHNLDVFQFENNLYFQANREINEGEELLVCYREEDMQVSDSGEESYYNPIVKKIPENIFACTFCCLGFNLRECFDEHKTKCSVYCSNTQDIIQCSHCKVWLKKQKDVEYHMAHYCTNCSRLRSSVSVVTDQSKTNGPIYTENIDEKNKKNNDKSTMKKKKNSIRPTRTTSKQKLASKMDTKKLQSTKSHKRIFKCPKCSYQTTHKSHFKTHELYVHNDTKQFSCEFCEKKFSRKHGLKRHMSDKHTECKKHTGGGSDCKCSGYAYGRNKKNHLLKNVILNKPFQCNICKKDFVQSYTLKRHMKDMHSENNDKDYKCYHCSYQTNYKNNLISHIKNHSGLKPFNCDICKTIFKPTYNEQSEIAFESLKKLSTSSNYITTIRNRKEYSCSECPYVTSLKRNFERHLEKHSDFRAFCCDLCQSAYKRKELLVRHIYNKHVAENSENYRCPKCFNTKQKMIA